MTPYLLESLKIILALFAVMQVILLVLIVVIFSLNNKYEIFLRLLAVISGILLYIIAACAGLKMPDLISGFMYYPLLTKIDLGIYLFGLVVPIILGIIISSYVSNYIRNYNDIEKNGNRSINIRWMCLMITLIFLLYMDQYMRFYKDIDETMDSLKPLIPDATFALSMLLFAVFRFKTGNPATTIQAAATDDRPGRSFTD